MIEFDATVRHRPDTGQVFSVLADLETYLARWAMGPVAAAKMDGDGGAGSRYMITARAGPATVRSPYEVTGYDPPGRLAGHGVAGPMRFQEEYRLTGDGAATILTQSITAIPRGPFRLAGGGGLRRQLQKLITSDLGRLKNLVEAEIPHS
jgi:hypothetical protein